jgi:hypothetical protein
VNRSSAGFLIVHGWAKKLKERIAPILVNEMWKKQTTSDEDFRRRIEQLVDQSIQEFCEE